MRTASGVSRDTKASENLSVGFESIHIDELVENQDDQEERPRGPEQSELQSAGLASIQERKLRTKLVCLITLVNVNFL